MPPGRFARRRGSATVLRRASLGWQRFARPVGGHADVAQLVEHHLAKVRVAGSNPVVRSEAPDAVLRGRRSTRLPGTLLLPADGAGKRRSGRVASARACKALYAGSIPASASRAVSSVGERYLDTVEVTGSIPVSPTQVRRTCPPRRASG